MFVTLRRYAGVAARAAEAARRTEEGLVPILKAQPGFKGYCAFASEQGDIVSVSIFEDREGALRANEQARGWVQSNLMDLFPDPPEVFSGPCGLAEVSQEQEQHAGSGQPLYVLIRKADLAVDPEAALAAARQHSAPVVINSPGFRGIYIIRDENNPSRGATITLFDSRENSQKSHEQVVRAMQEKMRGEVPNPPRLAASGQTLVMATA